MTVGRIEWVRLRFATPVSGALRSEEGLRIAAKRGHFNVVRYSIKSRTSRGVSD